MKSAIITLLFILFITQISFTQNDSLKDYLQPTELSSEEIYSRCSDAVVMVYQYDRGNALLGYGSGVVVSSNGHIYTNYHVIDKADRIEIRNGNTVYDSIPIVGFNPFNDAAILKLPEDSYPFISITQDYDVRVGSSLYALGNPQGYTKTFSYGIISAFRTDILPQQIQFDAPIAPGSSGGALLNTNGELIGITASCVTKGQNMNFAIPILNFINIPVIDANDSLQKESMSDLVKLYEYFLQKENAAELISGNIDLYKNDTAKWVFAGKLYEKNGLYDSAINSFSRAIELKPEDYDLYRLRGNCYNKSSDKVKALSDYETSISLNNSYIDTYIERANFYHYTLKDYNKALEDYAMILKINPEYDYVYTEKANCKLSLDDKEGAIQELSNSLLWKNDNPVLYKLRAEIYATLNLYSEAIDDYSIALSQYPIDVNFYLSRAILYSKLDDPVSAITDYQEYIKYNVDDPTAYNNIAYAYMSIEEYSLAEYNFNQALKYSKYHFDSYIGLSILNIRQGKTKASISNMCKAIEIQDLLLFGKPGLDELEKSGWFWDEKEKQDMKKIFKIMGITDRQVEPSESKEPKSRRVKREAAERNNN
jgi:tetratricopeptide (TPR) repeat protein